MKVNKWSSHLFYGEKAKHEMQNEKKKKKFPLLLKMILQSNVNVYEYVMLNAWSNDEQTYEDFETQKKIIGFKMADRFQSQRVKWFYCGKQIECNSLKRCIFFQFSKKFFVELFHMFLKIKLLWPFDIVYLLFAIWNLKLNLNRINFFFLLSIILLFFNKQKY